MNIDFAKLQYQYQLYKTEIDEAMFLDQNELQTNIQKVKEVYNWEEQEKVLLKNYKSLYEN